MALHNQNPWMKPLLALAAVIGAVGFAHWQALTGMVSIWWRSDTFAHALLVPPIVAWLVWRQRVVLRKLEPDVSAWGLLPIGLGLVLTTMGELAQVNAAQHFGLVFFMQGAVWLTLGDRVARRLAFPLLFLLFAPPFGEFLLPAMMEATADFTIAALRLTGVPVYREGLQFVIPSGHWSVVEACSGVRYLMASVMVGALFAYLNFNHWPKRLAFLAFATFMPLLANWVRAYLIVMLGHLSGNELATGADHLVYGWVFFGVIMMLMFWVGSRYADPLPPEAGPIVSTQTTAKRPALAWLTPVIASGLILVSAFWAQGVRTAPAQRDWPAMLSAPIQDLLVDRATGPALGRVASPDAEVRWTRISPDGQPLDVYVGYVAYQRGGSRAVSSTSIVVQRDDERWQILSEETVRVGVDEQRQILLRGREPSNEGEWRVRRVYWVDGWFGVSAIEAKWRGLWQLARGRGDAAAMLVLSRRDGIDANEVMNAEWERLRAPLNERLLMLSAPPAAGHNLAP